MNSQHDSNVHPPERLWVIPGTLALIALLFRLLFFSQFRATPFFERFFSDSRLYIEIARSIAEGDTLIAAVFMSPLYPAVIAAVLAVLGDPAVWMRLLQIAAGTVSVLLVFALGTRIFNRTSGYIAALFAALYPAFIFYDNQVLVESLLAFFFILHLYALIRGFDEKSRWWPAVAGLAMGGAVLLRANAALFLPVFAVYLWKRPALAVPKRNFALLYVAALLIAVLPFTIRNSLLADEFVPVTSSFGLNLYAGNNPASDGRYAVPEDIDSYRDPMGGNIAERAAGVPQTPMETSAYWRSRAIEWISSNPDDFLVLYGKKLAMFFQFGEIHQTGISIDFIRDQYITVLDLPLPPFAVVFALFLAGLALSWKWNAHRALAALFVLTYAASTALFFVNDRLRTPAVVLMVLFAGYAVAEALALLRARRYGKTAAVFGSAAVITVAFGFAQPSFHQSYDNEYNRMGDAAFQRGDFAAAEQYFAQSVKERASAVNLTNLGNALAAQRKYAEAEHAYEDAVRADETYAPAFFNKGNMAHQRGKPEVAFRYWSKTVELDPRYAPAYRNIGLLLMQAGQFSRARSVLGKYLELETDPRKKEEIRRDIARIDELLRRNPDN